MAALDLSQALPTSPAILNLKPNPRIRGVTLTWKVKYLSLHGNDHSAPCTCSVVNDLITPSATITASCCIPSQGRKLREALRAYHREFCQDHTHDCRVAILQEIRIILPVVCLSNYSLISPPKVKSRVKVNHQALSPYYPPGSHLPTA